MPLPNITGTARLVADPELRFTQSGKAACSVRLAFNSRRLNQQTNEWEDGDTFWVRGTAWDRLAEHVTETLAKGMEVVVSGELRTESWEKDGQKQQAPALLIRSIGPSLAFATADVKKAGATGGQAPAGQRPSPGRQQPPQDDPWATGPAGSDEPPF
ncbi:single-strand DNA-binding protein [Streptomyces sp. PvR006]|uniref:single-stranded DNA-binding protein n=1 Tax=Streptomyces sp. PvR006 TaxID=2817860 RepID=UPI001AE82DC5|nr:single-stranded DNA-binding protein [Streptomyces sp. PvR006]MBP2583359.1 single-strand DNA-binding protein [Streptomyces sp. PvR006]